jgi:hypothetical protein
MRTNILIRPYIATAELLVIVCETIYYKFIQNLLHMSYDIGILKYYSNSLFNKLKLCYNKYIIIFFKFDRLNLLYFNAVGSQFAQFRRSLC